MGLVIAGGIAVLALVAMSVWGARTLPPDSRIPLHHGFGGRWNNWVPKTTGLIAWPGIGVFVYLLTLATSSSPGSNGKTSPAFIAPIAVVILAFAYYNAIKVAIREYGRR